MNYLTNIPTSANEYGISKVLSVRSEVIHIKHILTEIFVRKTIDVSKHLEDVDITLFDYMEYMTNRIRKIHNFTREILVNKPEKIVKHRFRFFPSLELFKDLNNIVVLDFDGVVTDRKFEDLYNLCIKRSKVFICSANPTITEEWFNKRGLPLPNKIYSMKGKNKKLKKLIEINKKYDYIFYIDNETKYLDFAWIFGIKTFHWDGKKIIEFSKSSK